jgi:hypothetical protein
MPFYNPQKDPNPSPLFPNATPPLPYLPARSLISLSDIMDLPKPSNNISAYMKTHTADRVTVKELLNHEFFLNAERSEKKIAL